MLEGRIPRGACPESWFNDGRDRAAVIDLPPGRDPDGLGRDTYLDITRIHYDTGYLPEYGLERGMDDYIGWLRTGHKR